MQFRFQPSDRAFAAPHLDRSRDTNSRGATLLDSYRAIRHATMELCRPLATEDFVVQSMPDASPVKWHLAHTSWFFEEFVLQRFRADYRVHDRDFRYLFNSYYESVGPRHARPQRGVLSRPTVEQTFAYRAHVDEEMERLLAAQHDRDALRQIVTLGLHHEQQHQELILTDIKHAFSLNPLGPVYGQDRPAPDGDPPALAFHSVDGGAIEVGHDGRGFSFDNELPRHPTLLAPFRIANRLVTNEEFGSFITAGGYTHAAHWLSDGWAHARSEGWERPIYWAESLDHEFTLTGPRTLDPRAPVCHLSYYEADAFARWAGARLPTEFEWEAAARQVPIRGNFLEDGHWHPRPADRAGTSALQQMFGDAWEWTRSAYAPYPGYQPAEGALGEYNGKFMVNQMVLRGGSCATPRSHIRASYRNFFYPSARWQVTGLRLAKDSAG